MKLYMSYNNTYEVILRKSYTKRYTNTYEFIYTFAGGNEEAIKKYVEIQTARIEQLIQLVLGKLDKLDRRKIIAVITLDVHARDCNQELVDDKAEGPLAFAWLKQLRFYWIQETRDVLVKICDYRT